MNIPDKIVSITYCYNQQTDQQINKSFQKFDG